MSITIDTPAGIEYFAVLQYKHRLQLEIGTGLKFKQSTLAVVNNVFGQTFRTKKQALDYVLGVEAALLFAKAGEAA